MTARRTVSAALVAASLFTAACSEQQPEAQTSTASTRPAWLLVAAPEGAQSVNDVKATAAEGDRIVLRGRIGGRAEPITEGSPVFTIVDLSLPYCGQEAEDGCPVPWDYCCESPETIASNSATVQVVDEAGRPITHDLYRQGLNPLDEVVVIGDVAPRPSENVLTVRATGVYHAAVAEAIHRLSPASTKP